MICAELGRRIGCRCLSGSVAGVRSKMRSGGEWENNVFWLHSSVLASHPTGVLCGGLGEHYSALQGCSPESKPNSPGYGAQSRHEHPGARVQVQMQPKPSERQRIMSRNVGIFGGGGDGIAVRTSLIPVTIGHQWYLRQIIRLQCTKYIALLQTQLVSQ